MFHECQELYYYVLLTICFGWLYYLLNLSFWVMYNPTFSDIINIANTETVWIFIYDFAIISWSCASISIEVLPFRFHFIHKLHDILCIFKSSYSMTFHPNCKSWTNWFSHKFFCLFSYPWPVYFITGKCFVRCIFCQVWLNLHIWCICMLFQNRTHALLFKFIVVISDIVQLQVRWFAGPMMVFFHFL